MGDTNAVLIHIRGDVADINAKLTDLKGRIEKVTSETQQMGAAAKEHFGQIPEMAGRASGYVKGLATNVIALAVAYKTVQIGKDIFEKGFRGVEEYSQTVASMAAMVATFTERQKGASLSDQWKEALSYSQAIVPILENIAAKTLLSGQETTALANAFARTGVFLDAGNAKQVESFTRISNALPLMTQGQEIMRQINTEIRALMTGQNEATSMMLQTLKAIDPEIEKHLKAWRAEGTVLENIGNLLEGFGPATALLENQWQAVKSTIDTTVTQTLRGGMFPVYEDIIKQTKDINSFLEEHKGSIQGGMKVGWITVKEIVGGVKEFLGGFGPMIKDITSGVGAVVSKWYVVFGVLRPIGELIGNQISLTYELVKMFGNAIVAAGALAAMQPEVAKVAWEEAKKSYTKVEQLSLRQTDIVTKGIDESIAKYEALAKKALEADAGPGSDAASKKFKAKPISGLTAEEKKAAKQAQREEEAILASLTEQNKTYYETVVKEAKSAAELKRKIGENELDVVIELYAKEQTALNDWYEKQADIINRTFKADRVKQEKLHALYLEYSKRWSENENTKAIAVENYAKKAISTTAALYKIIADYSDESVAAEIANLDEKYRELARYTKDSELLARARAVDEQIIFTNRDKTILSAQQSFYAEINKNASEATAAQIALWQLEADEYIKKTKDQSGAAAWLREKIRQQEEGKATDQASFYDQIPGYSEVAYQYRLDVIEKQAEKHREAGDDAAAVGAWVADQNRKAYLKMAETSDDWFVGIKAGWMEMQDEAGKTAGKVKDVFKNAMDGLSEQLTDLLVDGEADFQSFAKSILKQLLKIEIQALITGQATSSLGGGGGGSWITSAIGLIGSMFGGSSYNTGGETDPELLGGMAKGGVVSGGRITPFAKGGTIVFNPTFFPMANGTGLMGEAGPEAVLPLKRLSNGNLGVQATGSQHTSIGISVPVSVTGSDTSERIWKSPAFRNEVETLVAALVRKYANA
ncbi:MAG: phage tail tape measure protein [Syntrophaceae bacterium]|nr:phage tail tape measure protein [Syntrophaceae bacterium]